MGVIQGSYRGLDRISIGLGFRVWQSLQESRYKRGFGVYVKAM